MIADNYDVVIAGGGMVGASLALGLSRYSDGRLRVLVVESFPLRSSSAEPRYQPSFDARSTALSYGSREIFDKWGVWSQLRSHVSPIKHIHVSDRGHFGSTLMHAEEQGWEALGYVVENAWLGNVLLAQLSDAPGVEFCAPATVTAAHSAPDHAQLTVEHDGEQQQIQAGLLVVADGAHSGLREQLGIGAHIRDYEQCALIANVCFQKPHDGTAYERFTDRGPLALLPLADSDDGEPRAALVWTLEPDEAAAMLEADEAEFLGALQSRFGYRQGRLTRVGERHVYPLQLIEAEEQLRSHIVVMGNAAHSLHPVAGQGFNLALRDVARLCQVLMAGSAGGETLGSLEQLQRYYQQQVSDQRLTVAFSDRLPALFGNRQPLLSVLRNIGLVALDVAAPAKARFVAQAAGVAPGITQG